jgi:hypothetical protein
MLQALLLQILFSIRSERQWVEAIDDNLLYRWVVGLNIDDKVWDHSTFSANRERLFNEDLAHVFFERVKRSAQWGQLASDEHFSVDGTLIEAWPRTSASSAVAMTAARRPGATLRWTSKGRSVATTPTRAPRMPMPACSRRARATSLACATWGTS